MKQIVLLLYGICMFICSTSQNRFDVLITELMADPSPAVGLPNTEWIELKNNSPVDINLSGWRIGDASGLSGPLPAYVLRPDSFVIITGSSGQALMARWGPTLSVSSFPGLDNTGDQVYIRSANGKSIHSVSYTDNWYQNDLKKEGGWSLEMIDAGNPCAGINNWTASNHSDGGSPGSANSVMQTNPDRTGPKPIRAYAVDSVSVVLTFSEPIDSIQAAIPGIYTLSDNLAVVNVSCTAPVFDQVVLRLQTPMIQNKIYTLSCKNQLRDCVGNPVESGISVRFGLSLPPQPGDVVINEVLFNPKPGGFDFVEWYNLSNKIIDTRQLVVATRSSTGSISNMKTLSNYNNLLFPGDFLVSTEDPEKIKEQYVTTHSSALLKTENMPGFSDDKGTVVLLNSQGLVLDELRYSEDWHFALINNPEGVSLERVDPLGPAQSPENWHSAATNVGYATPGYQNSQFKGKNNEPSPFTISPAIISPNQDGQDDFTTIEYRFPEPGYVLSIQLFDARGFKVRSLQQNALCGLQGSFRWDGLGDGGKQLAHGIYVVHCQSFNLKGEKKQYRHVLVLGGK